MPPLKFIGVPDLLSDVGLGIGRAARSAYLHSKTPISALVVKDAQVDIVFEMSTASVQRDASVGVGALGAKTLSFGTRSFDESQINRCTIRLNVISIEPPAEEPKPLALADAGLVPDDAAGLTRAAKKLAVAIQAQGIEPALRASLSNALDEVVHLAKSGEPAKARLALLRFMALHVRH